MSLKTKKTFTKRYSAQGRHPHKALRSVPTPRRTNPAQPRVSRFRDRRKILLSWATADPPTGRWTTMHGSGGISCWAGLNGAAAAGGRTWLLPPMPHAPGGPLTMNHVPDSVGALCCIISAAALSSPSASRTPAAPTDARPSSRCGRDCPARCACVPKCMSKEEREDSSPWPRW